MSRRARRSMVGVLSALAALVVGASLAWACTPSAYLFLSETGGGPGTTITVTGKEFAPGPVDIEWTGAPGAPSTTASGPSFSVSMAVPDLEPGVYYLQATATDDFGGIEGQATRAFRVSVPASGRTPGRAGVQPAPKPDGAPAPGGRAESRQAPQRSAPPASSPGSDFVTTRAAEPSGGRAAEPSGARQPAPAAAPATPTARGGGRAGVEGQFAPSSGRTPSQASVAADLWGGFASGRHPPLLPNATTASPASGSGSQMLGLALLGAGLVALSAGLVLAGLRRRRAPARRA